MGASSLAFTTHPTKKMNLVVAQINLLEEMQMGAGRKLVLTSRREWLERKMEAKASLGA